MSTRCTPRTDVPSATYAPAPARRTTPARISHGRAERSRLARARELKRRNDGGIAVAVARTRRQRRVPGPVIAVTRPRNGGARTVPPAPRPPHHGRGTRRPIRRGTRRPIRRPAHRTARPARPPADRP